LDFDYCAQFWVWPRERLLKMDWRFERAIANGDERREAAAAMAVGDARIR
jgi:hypothetical protein